MRSNRGGVEEKRDDDEEKGGVRKRRDGDIPEKTKVLECNAEITSKIIVWIRKESINK